MSIVRLRHADGSNHGEYVVERIPIVGERLRTETKQWLVLRVEHFLFSVVPALAKPHSSIAIPSANLIVTEWQDG